MGAEEKGPDNHNDDTLGCSSCNIAAPAATPLTVCVVNDDKDGTDLRR